MNGFLIFITLVISAVISGPYRYAVPNIYPVGREMVIHSDCGCGFRDIEPVEDIDHTVRQISSFETGITFTEGGIVSALKISCVHSFYETPVYLIETDWMFR